MRAKPWEVRRRRTWMPMEETFEGRRMSRNERDFTQRETHLGGGRGEDTDVGVRMRSEDGLSDLLLDVGGESLLKLVNVAPDGHLEVRNRTVSPQKPIKGKRSRRTSIRARSSIG